MLLMRPNSGGMLCPQNDCRVGISHSEGTFSPIFERTAQRERLPGYVLQSEFDIVRNLAGWGPYVANATKQRWYVVSAE